MLRRVLSLAPLVPLLACTPDPEGTGTPDSAEEDPTADWVLGEIEDVEGQGVLAQVETPWDVPLWVLRVEGTPYEMGYQYGRLTGEMIMDLWWMYMTALADEAGMDDAEALDAILGPLMDTAWENWFEPNVPEAFLEEIQGVADGMEAAGVEYDGGDLEDVPERIITLVDLAMSSQLDTDEIWGIGTFLSNGYTDELLAYYEEESRKAAPGVGPAPPPTAPGDGERSPWMNCSYFAAWGDRTDDGGQYVTRNMDFSADTGIHTYGMVTAFVPDDGVPHASISWVGASLGVLAGINQAGITLGAVGSSSPYERIATEPALLRAREVLTYATDVESALPYLRNSIDDGITRAPTIGYNALLAWGDPEAGGAEAQAVILESNGLETGVYHHQPDCSVDPALYRFAYDGSLDYEWTWDDHPEWANAESEAQEIDIEGNVRLFAHDGEGTLLTDENGDYYEDPENGIPIQTGYPSDCALYRGDEAMMYGVRIHQYAANGPQDGGDDLMIDSGSWNGRYWPMREMTVAYAEGTAYEHDGEEVIADNGGEPRPIGLDEVEQISRVAAMGSNVWDVVYDSTDLVMRVSYESGTGDDWTRAADQPAFLELELADLFLTD